MGFDNVSLTIDPHVHAVVRSAEHEIRELIRQRADVMKRIGTIKQTLAGLADLFGESILNDDLLDFLDRSSVVRQSGFTRACRAVLMESRVPLTARQVRDQVSEKDSGPDRAPQRSFGVGYYGAHAPGGLFGGAMYGARSRTPGVGMGCRDAAPSE